MEKIKTLADLKKKQDELRAKIDLREKGNTPEQHIQVKVAMATCGIASGAKEVMETFIEEFNKRNRLTFSGLFDWFISAGSSNHAVRMGLDVEQSKVDEVRSIPGGLRYVGLKRV